MNPTHWVPAATVGEFGENRKLARVIEGHEVLLIRLGQAFVAVSNRCTHLGRPLLQGRLMEGTLTCPYHGACFDLRNGAALSGPAVARLRCYKVLLEGDTLLIDAGLPY
ncbi:MAG TPA: Rieske 2Fe-2S domain-containing protein [Steroidobacteraceae bacterium]|jgi:nitrite reductase/ring-hydroxylating ferredoxin subunit